MSLNLNQIQKLAEKLVLNAGDILLKHKGKAVIKKYKKEQDFVTNVDLLIEKQTIALIEKQYPDHNILSEEIGEINKGSNYTWIIDPLDGTKEYIRNMILYCSAVSLQNKTDILTSAIYHPPVKELYSASRNNGAFLNGKKNKVSNQNKLKNSMLFGYLSKGKNSWKKLNLINQKSYRLRTHANHNLSYCWIAKGGYEAHINLNSLQKWWDIAPGILILQEAGGKVTDEENNNITPQNKSKFIIASNGKIHQQLLKLVNRKNI